MSQQRPTIHQKLEEQSDHGHFGDLRHLLGDPENSNLDEEMVHALREAMIQIPYSGQINAYEVVITEYDSTQLGRLAGEVVSNPGSFDLQWIKAEYPFERIKQYSAKDLQEREERKLGGILGVIESLDTDHLGEIPTGKSRYSGEGFDPGFFSQAEEYFADGNSG